MKYNTNDDCGKKPFERRKRQHLLVLEMGECCPIGFFFLTVKYRIENA